MLIHRLALVYLALGCSCSGSTPRSGEPATPEPPSTQPVTYEVHEWGLVRGTVDDRLMLSGAHAEPVAMPVAKPVLYFHRRGEGALVVDVEARVLNGHVVEHWPSLGAEVSDVVAWNDVLIQDGSCPTSRYPSMYDAVCLRLADGCEAATLAEVETSDSSCLFWPRPPDDDGPTESANHLFYRGEITRAPSLPLGAEVLPDGSLRVTTRGTTPIPGHLLRVRRANGAPGVQDALSVVLPESAAGLLSTLTFSPPPSAVRRAIVVWIDETHTR